MQRVAKMFRSFVALVEGRRPELSPLEQWATKAAALTTPDRLIAGHIVEQMAANFDEWTVHSKPTVNRHDHYAYHPSSTKWLEQEISQAEEWTKKFALLCLEKSSINRAIHNSKKKITVCYRIAGNKYDTFYVNGVSICLTDGLFIREAFQKMLKQAEAVKAAADKAKRDMEHNEAKWNVYEQIAGYRRNAQGGLEPVKPVEAIAPVEEHPVRQPKRRSKKKEASLLQPLCDHTVSTTVNTFDDLTCGCCP